MRANQKIITARTAKRGHARADRGQGQHGNEKHVAGPSMPVRAFAKQQCGSAGEYRDAPGACVEDQDSCRRAAD